LTNLSARSGGPNSDLPTRLWGHCCTDEVKPLCEADKLSMPLVKVGVASDFPHLCLDLVSSRRVRLVVPLAQQYDNFAIERPLRIPLRDLHVEGTLKVTEGQTSVSERLSAGRELFFVRS